MFYAMKMLNILDGCSRNTVEIEWIINSKTAAHLCFLIFCNHIIRLYINPKYSLIYYQTHFIFLILQNRFSVVFPCFYITFSSTPQAWPDLLCSHLQTSHRTGTATRWSGKTDSIISEYQKSFVVEKSKTYKNMLLTLTF